MPDTASDLARRLADNAEAVCRHYLSNGRREGRWWTVGDVHNTPGRSMMVRLKGTDRGSAGKWTDAATGEHGDLLDLIAQGQGCATLADTLNEARRFLSLPRPEPREPVTPAPQGSPEAARRLFGMSKPIRGTIVETYLRTRGITDLRDCTSLRFHPRCYYRGDEDDPTDAPDTWPALIAAATDLTGVIIGVHRTWLDPSVTGVAERANLRASSARSRVPSARPDIQVQGSVVARRRGAAASDADGRRPRRSHSGRPNGGSSSRPASCANAGPASGQPRSPNTSAIYSATA